MFKDWPDVTVVKRHAASTKTSPMRITLYSKKGLPDKSQPLIAPSAPFEVSRCDSRENRLISWPNNFIPYSCINILCRHVHLALLIHHLTNACSDDH